jgi:hypothetical protein
MDFRKSDITYNLKAKHIILKIINVLNSGGYLKHIQISILQIQFSVISKSLKNILGIKPSKTQNLKTIFFKIYGLKTDLKMEFK